MSAGCARRTQLAAHLNETLAQALGGASRLQAHLHETGAVLARGDHAALEQRLQHERELLDGLETLFQRQHAVLREHGFGSDRTGLEQALEWCGDEALHARWQALRGLLAECRAHNRSNARIAQRTSVSASAALRILRGGDATPSAYGPRGEVHGGDKGHTLARA